MGLLYSNYAIFAIDWLESLFEASLVRGRQLRQVTGAPRLLQLPPQKSNYYSLGKSFGRFAISKCLLINLNYVINNNAIIALIRCLLRAPQVGDPPFGTIYYPYII